MPIRSCASRALAVVLTGLLAVPPALAQAPQISLRDFFRNPEKAAFRVSPDGRHISFTQPYQSRMNVMVMPVGSTEARRITAVTDRDISSYFWKGNGRILFQRDFGGDENFHLFSADIATGKTVDLTPFDSTRVNVVDELRGSDTDVIVELNRRRRDVFDAYRLNTVTGQLTLIAENPGNITGWVTDHAGQIRVATTSDGVNTSLLYRATPRDSFRVVVTTNFKEQLTPLFFDFDNRALYALSNIGRDKTAIVKLDPATARELQVLFSRPDVDVDGMEFSRKRKVLTEASYTTWKGQREYLDSATARVYQALEQRLPGYEVFVTSTDRAEDRMIVRTLNDRSLGSYYLYQSGRDKLTKIADRNPWLREADLAPMKPITYQARDGLTINGYLTLPNGMAAQQLPVVVIPHGGPWARDVWGFDPEVQFLANRGYAVLQINFRGSTGYGRGFWESSFKQWGRKMQDDVSDGVRWLVGQGMADPKRIAIYGGSYGGYATLAGVTFTPELYAAAVDYVGVSNMFTFMTTIPPYWEPYRKMLYEMVGDPVADSALLDSVSPALHVDRIRVPLLVAQGAKDPRVNINESNQIVDALRARGIDVQYIVKDNEGHGFHNEENRMDFYGAMETFLAKHLAPVPKSGI
jgi:dipeptidyl aminopeptidase/acylaminoacyl peptidase